WDISRWRRVRILKSSARGFSELSFVPSGATLASASGEGGVMLWDASGKTSSAAVKFEQAGVRDLAFAPDGQSIAASGSAGVYFYASRDGRLLKEIRGERLGFLGFTHGSNNFLLVRYSARHNLRKTILDGATRAERLTLARGLAVIPSFLPTVTQL